MSINGFLLHSILQVQEVGKEGGEEAVGAVGKGRRQVVLIRKPQVVPASQVKCSHTTSGLLHYSDNRTLVGEAQKY